MNDRELIELAAKAAGYNVRWHENWQCFVHVSLFNITNPPTMAGQRMVWVPLNDDGDRYRLAKRLGISIDFADCCAWMRLPDGGIIQEFWGGDCGDEAHAIVHVAAEIGRQI